MLMTIRNKHSYDIVHIYYIGVITVMFMDVMLLILLPNSNVVFANIFWQNKNYTFYDCFQMIAFGWHPYENGSLYPPFAHLIFMIFKFFFVRDTAISLQVFFLVIIIFSFVPLAVIAFCVCRILIEKKYRIIESLLIVFSSGMVFAIERGNIIIWAFAFLMLFICSYNSNNKWIRVFSCICLASSAAIKIYPAIFGVILLKKGGMAKQAIFTACSGICFTFFPFAFFGGYKYMVTWLSAMATSSFSSVQNVGFNISISSSMRVLGYIFNNMDLTSCSYTIKISIIIICCLVLLVSKELWRVLLSCGVLCIVLSESNSFYSIIWIIPGVIYFLNYSSLYSSQNKKKTLTNCLICICLILCMAFLVTPHLSVLSVFDSDYYQYNGQITFLGSYSGCDHYYLSVLIKSISVILLAPLVLISEIQESIKSYIENTRNIQINTK